MANTTDQFEILIEEIGKIGNEIEGIKHILSRNTKSAETNQGEDSPGLKRIQTLLVQLKESISDDKQRNIHFIHTFHNEILPHLSAIPAQKEIIHRPFIKFPSATSRVLFYIVFIGTIVFSILVPTLYYSILEERNLAFKYKQERDRYGKELVRNAYLNEVIKMKYPNQYSISLKNYETNKKAIHESLDTKVRNGELILFP